MPIPEPEDDETEDEFISRCMEWMNENNEGEDQEQRSAICHSQWRERENMKRIDVRLNSDKVRQETVNDQEYLVAPVVAVKEGVLNYEDGAEFIPAEEIKNSVNWWNGVDLPIGHPEQRGQPISAKNKVVIDKNAVGRMWNAHYEDKKLKGELWVDIKKAENMGSTAQEVIDLLENEEPIDVSTAYQRQAEQDSGEYNGEQYDRVQHNLRPDHLALLPHSTGNMSWSDGVGTPRLNEAGDYMEVNARSTARTPSFSGTSTGSWNAPGLGDFGFDSVSDMSSSDKTDVAEHSLLGEAGADTFSELLVLPVVSADGTLYKSALANAKARVNQVSGISSDTVDSVKSRCTQLLEDEFDVENEEQVENLGNKVIDFVKNHFRGEQEMSEEMEVVVENTGFDADDLEDMEDEKIETWAGAYNEEPDEPEEEVENEEPDEPEEKSEDTASEQITNEQKEKMYDEFKERKENEEVVEDVLELDDENFDEEGLLANSLEQNKSIKNSLEKQKNEAVDYSGRPVPNVEDTEQTASESMSEHLGL